MFSPSMVIWLKRDAAHSSCPASPESSLLHRMGPGRDHSSEYSVSRVHLGSKTKQGIVLAHDSETIGNVVISSEEMGKLCFLHWQKILIGLKFASSDMNFS